MSLTASSTETPLANLWDSHEAAQYLRTTPACLHVKICRKEIPKELFTRMGRKLLFFPVKVMKWVEFGCPATGVIE